MSQVSAAIQQQPAKPKSSWLDKNEVHLCGELIRDPELRYTQNGKAVCNFTLCTKSGEHRTFHNCVAWEELAEQVATLKNPPTKDRQRVKVVGRLQTRQWETKTGDKRVTTEIVCRQVAVEGSNGLFINDHGLEVSDADIPF